MDRSRSPVGPTVSYAQHGEDIVLTRALPSDEGFYVDVGAFDPTVDSVTRLFYERGWRGVNIEPSREAIERFKRERPEDVNLAVAAGAEDGEIEFHVTDVPGWSTTDPAAAEALQRDGHVVKQVTVPLRRLSGILDELAPQVVDFLKIDVEGAEVQVVTGLDLERHRPRVIVMEGTAPGTTEGYVGPALEMLERAGYRRAGFDGLNHYLTCEPELVSRLVSPANPTDGYVKYSVAQLEARASWLDDIVRERDAALVAKDSALERVTSERESALEELATVGEALQLVLASRSWRLTEPLRTARRLTRGQRLSFRPPLVVLDDFLRRRPGLRDRLISVAVRYPGLAARLEAAVHRRRPAYADMGISYDAVSERRATAMEALAERARRRRGVR